MDFLDNIIFDNSVKSLLIVFAIIAVVLLFKRLLSHSIASLLFLLVRKKWETIQKNDFISLTIKPLSWFLVIVIADLVIDRLNFPAAWNFKIRNIPLQVILEKAANTLIIASFFYFVVSLINFIALLLETTANAAKDKSHGQVVIFFRDLLKVVVSIAGILFIMRAAFNQDIGSLLTGLSIVGAALALAAKESIENLIASFIIFFDKPFFTGDTLKVNNVSGTVERIGLRSTRIRTAEKTLITVPNKQMVDSVVDNLSMRNQRRAEILLALSEKTKSEKLYKLIEDIKALLNDMQEEVMKNTVFLTDFNKEGAHITVEYFTRPVSMTEYNKIKQDINFKIMKLIEAEDELNMSTAAGNVNIVNNNAGAAKQQPII